MPKWRSWGQKPPNPCPEHAQLPLDEANLPNLQPNFPLISNLIATRQDNKDNKLHRKRIPPTEIELKNPLLMFDTSVSHKRAFVN